MKRIIATVIVAFFSSIILIIWIYDLGYFIAIIAWAVTAFVLAVFLIGIIALAVFAAFWVLASFEKYLQIRARRRESDYQATGKKYLSYQDGFGMVHLLNLETDAIENLSAFPGTHHNGQWEEPHPAAAAAWYALINKRLGESPVKALLPEPQKQPPNLFDILSRAERVLVKGPTHSGKTTLFRAIVRQSQDTVIVVDPHYKPGLWPENCKIVGAGRNHQDISRFLDWLSSELDRRYKLRAQGNEGYRPLTIIIDEWMSIANRCENAVRVITEMITESRKSRMRLFIGSHSDQVEALGIRGQGKLREGLLIVRLYYDQVTGERRSTFDYGQGERDCCLYEPMLSEDDRIRAALNQLGPDASYREISEAVWGTGKWGSHYNRMIDEVKGNG